MTSGITEEPPSASCLLLVCCQPQDAIHYFADSDQLVVWWPCRAVLQLGRLKSSMRACATCMRACLSDTGQFARSRAMIHLDLARRDKLSECALQWLSLALIVEVERYVCRSHDHTTTTHHLAETTTLQRFTTTKPSCAISGLFRYGCGPSLRSCPWSVVKPGTAASGVVHASRSAATRAHLKYVPVPLSLQQHQSGQVCRRSSSSIGLVDLYSNAETWRGALPPKRTPSGGPFVP